MDIIQGVNMPDFGTELNYDEGEAIRRLYAGTELIGFGRKTTSRHVTGYDLTRSVEVSATSYMEAARGIWLALRIRELEKTNDR